MLFPAVACLALLGWASPSILIVKKVIGLLVLPSGLVWLGLMALVGWPGLNRWCRFFAVLVLVAYSLAGNAWTGSWLLEKLESPYYKSMSRPAEPLDAICVLGGGSSSTPGGEPQLGPAGDRLIVPVKLFLAGRTKHLVTSGRCVTDISGSRSLADETAALWRTLGIPDAAITRLSEPRNTREEIRDYKTLIAAKSWKRVGVCTSAWHMRRVEQLCRKEGVEMVPIPADFLSASLPWTPMYAVPQARGFQDVQKALWEYLGAFAGG